MAKKLRTLTHPDFTTTGRALTHEELDQTLIDIWNAIGSGGGGGGTPLSAGTIALGSAGDGTVTINSTAAASGGTAPYAYQWHRSTTSGFTPSTSNDLVGETGASLTDTSVTNGTTYYYKRVVTDDSGATASTGQVSATPQAAGGGEVAFVNDTFTDTDGTNLTAHSPEIGAAYINITDGATIQGGRARRISTSSTANIINTAAPSAADYAVEVDIVATTMAGGGHAGALARFSNTPGTQNGYLFRNSTSGGHTLKIQKFVAGTPTSLGADPDEIAWTPVDGTIYRLRMEVEGSTIRGYVDGVLQITINDTNSPILSAGFAGIRISGGNTASDYHVDNLIAESLA